MTPELLRALLAQVAADAARTGGLPDEAEAGPPRGAWFRPADLRAAGVVADWVTPVAQRWAPQLGLEPRDLARTLAAGLSERSEVQSVEVTPSGLVSLTLTDTVRAAALDVVRHDPDGYALPPGTSYAEVVERPGARDPADPLRRAQLSHARLCRIVRNARACGVEQRPTVRLERLTHVTERQLLVAVADLPQRLERHVGDPVQQQRAVTDLAGLADAWDHPTRPRVVGDPVEAVHGARLVLADTVRVVLRNGLARVGAAAPERM